MIKHKHFLNESFFDKSKRFIKKYKIIIGVSILLICFLIYYYWKNIKSYWNKLRGIEKKEDKKKKDKKKEDKKEQESKARVSKTMTTYKKAKNEVAKDPYNYKKQLALTDAKEKYLYEEKQYEKIKSSRRSSGISNRQSSEQSSGQSSGQSYRQSYGQSSGQSQESIYTRPKGKKRCQCDNGLGLIGGDCPPLGNKHICDSDGCYDGYHYSDNKCKINKCKCEYGDGEEGENCKEHNHKNCARCKNGFEKVVINGKNVCQKQCPSGYHPHENRCVLKKCKCDNGTPAVESSCPEDNANKCVKCNNGYILKNSKCVLKQCTCIGGTPAKGKHCIKDGAEMCDPNSDCHNHKGYFRHHSSKNILKQRSYTCKKYDLSERPTKLTVRFSALNLKEDQRIAKKQTNFYKAHNHLQSTREYIKSQLQKQYPNSRIIIEDIKRGSMNFSIIIDPDNKDYKKLSDEDSVEKVINKLFAKKTAQNKKFQSIYKNKSKKNYGKGVVTTIKKLESTHEYKTGSNIIKDKNGENRIYKCESNHDCEKYNENNVSDYCDKNTKSCLMKCNSVKDLCKYVSNINVNSYHEQPYKARCIYAREDITSPYKHMCPLGPIKCTSDPKTNFSRMCNPTTNTIDSNCSELKSVQGKVKTILANDSKCDKVHNITNWNKNGIEYGLDSNENFVYDNDKACRYTNNSREPSPSPSPSPSSPSPSSPSPSPPSSPPSPSPS